MDANIAVAVIAAVTAAASTAGVAITALVLNNKSFDLMEKRIDRLDLRLDKIEGTLALIQSNLNEFYKEITRIKPKLAWNSV